jgi:hypothetical protein
MNNKVLIILASVAGFLLLSCGVCGVGFVVFALPKIRAAAERVQRVNQMKVIGIAVHNVIDTLNRGPANVDEIAPYLPANDPLAVEALNRLRKGEIEMAWNALKPTQQPDGASQVLIAWEARPDADGQRVVAYLDGTSAILTDQEFQTKLKAWTSLMFKD